jgi:enoyl-CoA hydratase
LPTLNGDAIGGGAELAVACDMRLVTSHARIGVLQGRMGITSARGGGPDLCALVGSARAMRMMSRCEMADAELAVAWGFAELVVRDGPEGADTTGFLKPLLDRSALVLRGIKAATSASRELVRASQRATCLVSESELQRRAHHDDVCAISFGNPRPVRERGRRVE